MHLAGV